MKCNYFECPHARREYRVVGNRKLGCYKCEQTRGRVYSDTECEYADTWLSEEEIEDAEAEYGYRG
jgi:hypothetical protein